MPSPNPIAGITVPNPGPSGPVSVEPSVSHVGSPATGSPEHVVAGPIPPIPVTKTSTPGMLPDSPAEAVGRRILSTAFVRVGPDGHMTVESSDGRVLVLRDVVMRAKDYCGVQVTGDPARARYCSGYAEVAAARPGGGPATDRPDVATANLVAAP